MITWFYDLLKPQWGRSPLKDRVVNFFALGVRKILIALGVNFVWCDQVKGQPFWLPFGDDFSINMRLYPDYGYNMARVASLCLEKYPNLHFIDIGAALGDSIAQLRLYGKFPILAINPGVAGLKRNFEICPEITIVDAYVSGKTSQGITVPALMHQETPVLALGEIVEKYPAFKTAHCVKVDTDGVDCAILRDNELWLQEHKPVIFFEYDPRHAAAFKDTVADIFSRLERVGYEIAMVYGSNGVFLFSAPLANHEIWEELHHSVLRYNATSYFDICAFSTADHDIYAKARELELNQPAVE
jgi:hypothetical protein